LTRTGEGEAFDVNGEDTHTATIPFALPGEQIAFECHTYKKKKRYFPTEVLTPSADRVEPVCKHFSHCGGCMLQHMGTRIYKEFKQSQLTEALLEHGLDPFVVDGITVLPFGKRRRANMDVIRKGDTIFMGFHRYKSHQIINVEECFTLDPALVTLLEPLRAALLHVLGPFEKAKLFFTKSKVGVDISLEIQGMATLTPTQREPLRAFAEKAAVARLTFRYRKTLDVIYESAKPVVTFAGLDVEVDAYSFLQASDEADQFLSDFVLSHLDKDAKNIVDLFCGRGTLSLPLSTKAPVTGYEFERSALAALQKVTPLAKHTVHLHYRDLFDLPLTWQELAPFDVIVIDPPRAGAEAQCKMMASCKAQQIIYVSCNPETFARDAKILTDGAFELVKVHGLDQFAWSPHVEVLAIFKRRG
jgi:23S rRNA (uracil1939-C5)-methyltransferase